MVHEQYHCKLDALQMRIITYYTKPPRHQGLILAGDQVPLKMAPNDCFPVIQRWKLKCVFLCSNLECPERPLHHRASTSHYIHLQGETPGLRRSWSWENRIDLLTQVLKIQKPLPTEVSLRSRSHGG